MRFFVSVQVGKQAPGAAHLWEQGALKSVKRKTSLRKQVTSTVRELQVNDSESRTSTRLAIEVPARAYESVFGRITRGLYFFNAGKILPPNTNVQVVPLASPPDEAILQPFERHQIAGGAFVYWFGLAHDEPSSSLWLYQFYGIHWVQATTGSASDA